MIDRESVAGFSFCYLYVVAQTLPALYIDYLLVLKSKVGLIDPFTFFVCTSFYFFFKLAFTPFFLFLKFFNLLDFLYVVKSFLGFKELQDNAILANFNFYSYIILKYAYFLKIYREIIRIQFSTLEIHKNKKLEQIENEFNLNQNEYQYIFSKREVRFHELLLQIGFSVIYAILIILILILFNLRTTEAEYFLRLLTEFDHNPLYRLRYGHYYK